MLTQIKGLHHVTSLASSAQANNAFFTGALGLRRVKKTVNFDAPDVYHLYYGDEAGTPGTVMTYFPFPNAAPGARGAGEVGRTAFAIPPGTARVWAERLAGLGATGIARETRFGEARVLFDGPDDDAFALVESDDDRSPWTGGGIGAETAIRGFHSAEMILRDDGATRELLGFMGYEAVDTRDGTTRFQIEGGNAANRIDLTRAPDAPDARQSAGSPPGSPAHRNRRPASGAPP